MVDVPYFSSLPMGGRASRRRMRVCASATFIFLAFAFSSAQATYLNLDYFWQCDPAWGSHPLGTSSLTLCSHGCAVTSSAMVFMYYGGTMNPDELNSCLIENGGFYQDSLIIWDSSCMPSGVAFQGTSGDIDEELAAGRPVIAHVSNASIEMHFVVIVGNDNGYQILDPYFPSYQTISDGGYTIEGIRIYSGNAADPCDVRVTNQAETVIDDSSPCFRRHGSYWWTSDTGHDGSHIFTYAMEGPDHDCWGEWIFSVEDTGEYEVQVFIPETDAETQNARYVVGDGAGESYAAVDQLQSSDWTSLGIFSFAATDTGYISLHDNTGEPLSSHIPIAFDAVKLIPKNASADAGAPRIDAAWDGGSIDDAGSPPRSRETGCGCRSEGSIPCNGNALVLSWLFLLLVRRRPQREIRGRLVPRSR